jgi:aryl-alcohol dehydrogenase-like predicted oxidoreductase
MEYTKLGDTGLTVSRLCLGCMSFGDPRWRNWVKDKSFGLELVERARTEGINFFDTANIYSLGESERILGDGLRGEMDEAVISTKVYFPMDEDDPNSVGLSRKTIEQELEASLKRLGSDTIDVYYVHRWDYDTPIEETMRTLDDAVRRGNIRYLGASSMWTHQFVESFRVAERLGLETFSTMQNHYNLVYREEEREMLPFCEREGVAIVPWSPLAKGFLARPHEEYETTARAKETLSATYHPYADGGGIEINERVQELAADKDASMAQIAIAWLLHKDWVTAPVIGPSSLEHLDDAIGALEIELSSNDMEYLEEPYEPVVVSGHD